MLQLIQDELHVPELPFLNNNSYSGISGWGGPEKYISHFVACILLLICGFIT